MTDEGGPSASDSLAQAIGLQAGAGNAELTRKQIEFLERQGQVQAGTLRQFELQAEKLREEIGNLRDAQAGQRIQNLRDRLRIVFDVAVSLVVILLVALAGWGVYSATRARSVVINAFDAPAAFEQRGLNGTAVAGGVLDRLHALQDATRTSTVKRDIEDAWSGDIKLEIPEAHVSIGELQRYLRQWLGHETYLSGSLVDAGDHIELTVRGSGVAARTFSGKPGELAALSAQAAEYIYGESEPTLFDSYLSTHSRDDEAIAFAQSHFARVNGLDRALMLNAWANSLADQGKFPEAMEKHREALSLNQDFWVAYNNLINDYFLLEDEEAAYRTGRELERRAHRHSLAGSKAPNVFYLNLDTMIMDLQAEHAELLEDEAANHGEGTSTAQDAPADAEMMARMHDPRHARLLLETSPGKGSDPYVLAETDYVNGWIALDSGDTTAALAAFEALQQKLDTNPGLLSNLNFPYCWIARAEALSDRYPQAEAALAKGGHLLDCYRFRADLDDRRGDWPQAQKDYAAAVALAPDLPGGYQSWGEALARHGDLDGAIVRFRQARQRGPHWADPLKALGDALEAQGHHREAMDEYQEAEAYAPNWGALHLRWGQALEKDGRHARAVDQYRRALELDLNETERKALANCCG